MARLGGPMPAESPGRQPRQQPGRGQARQLGDGFPHFQGPQFLPQGEEQQAQVAEGTQAVGHAQRARPQVHAKEKKHRQQAHSARDKKR